MSDYRALLSLLAAVGWIVLASAAGGSQERDLRQAVRERGLDPEAIVDPLALTDEMREWVRVRMESMRGDPEQRLRALLVALLDADDLAIEYAVDAHGTAAEVFATRKANCLAFTNLFVGMAREAGLDAYYVEIRRRPRYEQEGDLVLVWEHVTAGYGPEHQRLVLEFTLGPPVEASVSRRLSDLTALAMYYSNRGAERLRAGDPEAAREWLETAVRLDPDWAHAWLNLGVARRRSRDLEGAEAAYRAALAADPEQLQAYHNLAALLRLRGERQAAREILRLLDRRDNRDPYIYLALGDSSLDAGRLAEARRYYRRALSLEPRQAEPRAALGLWALAAGHEKKAREWLRKAERYGTGTTRVEKLRRRLESAEPPGPLESPPES